MLPATIIEQIKVKSGLSLTAPSDYESLSLAMNLGVNTLKRLCGYTPEDVEARPSTLNIVAQYLDHDSWEILVGIVPSDSEWSSRSLYADEIRIGESIVIEWLPNRSLRLKCVKENGFEVEESINGKLCVGDEVHFELIRTQQPLVITNIVRQGTLLTDEQGKRLNYVAGKQNGITRFHIIAND